MPEDYNQAWLKVELTGALGWDAFIVDGVVDAIANAQNQDDIQDIVQNFMGGDPVAASIVGTFLKHNVRSAAQPTQRSQTRPGNPGRNTGPASQPEVARTDAAPEGLLPYSKARANDLAYVTATAPPPAAKGKQRRKVESENAVQSMDDGREAAGSSRAAPDKVLGIFKPGGKLKGSAGARGGAPSASGGPLAAAAALERKVVNCLSCGKVYDCRNVSSDIATFLSRGGTCTFCSNPVGLTYSHGSRHAAAAPQPTAAAAPHPSAASSSSSLTRTTATAGGKSSGSPARAGSGAAGAGGGGGGSLPEARGKEEEAAAAAVALKDRLVGYDRNAAQRTAVIDDQSDYFEIDSNQWLNEQEREELRRRRVVEAEAEAARRRRVTVTLDLIGRQVLLEDDGGGEDGPCAGPSRVAQADKAGNAASQAGVSQPGDAKENVDPHALAGAADVFTSRISANPSIAVPSPLFIPHAASSSQEQKGVAPKAPSKTSHSGSKAAAAAGSTCRVPGGFSRVDDPAEELFADFASTLQSL